MILIELPSQELLLKFLRYERETGLLYWRERDIMMSSSMMGMNKFNYLHANQEAVTGYSRGYKQTVIKKQTYLSHRLIWKLIYNEDPRQIDHIDGNRINNRIENLRSVTNSENCRNRKRSTSNRSGRTGVTYNSKRQQWRAYISTNGEQIHLGSFTTIEAAIEAREKAEIQFGYHPNHDRE